MPVLLHVSASPSGSASHSRKAGQAFIAKFREIVDIIITERDLSRRPPPYPDQTFVEASLMAAKERGTRELAALAYSETLIVELEAADLVVIDTPMHNFIVPSVLKTWVDYVVRPGRTFRNTPEGKRGLLSNRPVFIIIACGGSFSAPIGREQTDFLTPYLHYVLATVGLHDVFTLRLENLRRGTAAIEQAEAQATAWIIDQATRWQKRQHGGCRIL